MILLTPELRQRLLANGRRRGLDHVPVVKFFNPLGIGTWLAAELDEDGDTLFGLCRVQHKPNYAQRGIMLNHKLRARFFGILSRCAPHNNGARRTGVKAQKLSSLHRSVATGFGPGWGRIVNAILFETGYAPGSRSLRKRGRLSAWNLCSSLRTQ